jgi:Vitamin K-dependent gamma-carboxylase
VTRLVGAWNRFWFEPQATSTLALFRVAFGLLTFAWTLALAPDLITFFGRDGIVPQAPEYGRLQLPWTWGLLNGAPADGIVIALFATLLVASACVVVGFRTRLASAVAFVAILSFERRNPFVFNAGDTLIRAMALYLLLAPAGASFSIDRLRRSRDRFWDFPARSPWALRLVQIQVSVIYLSTVWEKLHGETWRNGTAVSYALRTEDIQRIALPHWIVDSTLVSGVLTYGTLATELAVGILIWNRRARPFVIVPGILLHLFIDATLTAGFFSAAMLTAYVAFVAPDTASRWILRARERLLRGLPRSENLGAWAEGAENSAAAPAGRRG